MAAMRIPLWYFVKISSRKDWNHLTLRMSRVRVCVCVYDELHTRERIANSAIRSGKSTNRKCVFPGQLAATVLRWLFPVPYFFFFLFFFFLLSQNAPTKPTLCRAIQPPQLNAAEYETIVPLLCRPFYFPYPFLLQGWPSKPSFLRETRLGNREPVLSQAVALKKKSRSSGISRKRRGWESGRSANAFRFYIDLLQWPFHRNIVLGNLSLSLSLSLLFCYLHDFRDILWINSSLVEICWTRDVKLSLTVSHFHFVGNSQQKVLKIACTCFKLLD